MRLTKGRYYFDPVNAGRKEIYMFDLKTPFDLIADAFLIGTEAVKTGDEEAAVNALRQIKHEANLALMAFDAVQKVAAQDGQH